MCSLLRNGEYTVKITRRTRPRTISQNSLMWMWYACMEESTGTPKDDIHEYYKAKYLSREVWIGGRPCRVPGSTAKLNTMQFTAYLDKIKADAAAEYGIMLPLPEDASYQAFVTEYSAR